ncbi:hypothetical protein, partial [Agathobaculum sp.]|uniref:hypothetical protein n=1 Tax=Agathobaculum sp. TaxID=2048138 RepID=UPI003AB4C0BC
MQMNLHAVRRGRTPGHLLLPFGQFTLPHPTIWRYMTIIPDKNTITRFIPRSFSILHSQFSITAQK